MTTRTRRFVITSLVVIFGGLGTGLVAYYVGFPTSAFTRQGGPDELQLVPSDTSLLAYADVHEIMSSDLRQRIRVLVPMKEDGQREFESQTGINIETDIDRVIAAVTPSHDSSSNPANKNTVLVIARGRFDEPKIEALMRDHGASVDVYKGKRVAVASPPQGQPMAVAFVEPGLVAIGSETLVRNAVDLKDGGASVTTNDEIMSLVRDLDSGDAWAVGRFDVLASQAQLPVGVNLPAITWFSASAHIDSGIRGTLRAEARDEDAANGLRDVIRGIVSLGKMQSPAQFQAVLNSLQLGGTGKTVALSFDFPATLFDALQGLNRPQVQAQH